jgi:hypothetical protein
MFGLFKRKRGISRNDFAKKIESRLNCSSDDCGEIKQDLGSGWEPLLDQLYRECGPQVSGPAAKAALERCEETILEVRHRVVVQRELIRELAKLGVDFLTLHPTIQGVLVREGLLFGRIPRSVGVFVELRDSASLEGLSEEQRAAMLLGTFEERLKSLHWAARRYSQDGTAAA